MSDKDLLKYYKQIVECQSDVIDAQKRLLETLQNELLKVVLGE